MKTYMTTLHYQGFDTYSWVEMEDAGYPSISEWEAYNIPASDYSVYQTHELDGRIQDERGPVYTDGSGRTFIMVWEE